MDGCQLRLLPGARGSVAKLTPTLTLTLALTLITPTPTPTPTQERGSVAKLSQVIQEMNEFEELKRMRTTGERSDRLRPGGQTLETQLESEARRDTLNPPKVVELLARDLNPDATIVDVGAGTGLFSFPFAEAMPEAAVFALEVRTDALQLLHARVAKSAAPGSNVQPLRMDEGVVPSLPGGTKADLLFLCDVLDFVPAADKDRYLLSLRSLLAEGGRLVVIESRDHWETHLVDIQDAGFVQRRIAQIVAARRMMAFEADPAAKPPPPSPAAPAALPEDTQPPPKSPPPEAIGPAETGMPPAPPALSAEEEFNRQVNATGYEIGRGDVGKGVAMGTGQIAPGFYGTEPATATGKAAAAAAAAAADDDDEECLLEENPTIEDITEEVAAKAEEGDDDDDDDECMLETNPTEEASKPSAEVDSDDDDGCMLEDN